MTETAQGQDGGPAEDGATVASLAVTIDGYIARPDGSVEYLESHPVPDYDFDAWVAGIGALVMGRASYEQVVEWGWTWGDRPTLVLTNREDLPVPEGAVIEFRSAPTAEAVREFAARTPGRLWVFGGGQVVTEAMAGGAVDLLDVVVIPEAIGTGLPLFTEPLSVPLEVVEATPLANGAVRLVYRVGG